MMQSPYFQKSKSVMKTRSNKISRPMKNKLICAENTAAKLKVSKKVKQHVTSSAKIPKLNWAPKQWEEQFKNIQIMRQNHDAPVDTMGCEKCKGDNYSEKEKRFHILVSLMLSSQTKDHVTHAAMNRLLSKDLTVENVIRMSDKLLGDLIYPVGFWKKKVTYIKKTSIILRDEYNCDIPDSIDKLVKLPGVGPKMAYLTMTCAWNKVVGIGVDVHVHRIANRLGWVKKTTSDPEKTRLELEDWLPQSYWKEANWLLVGFGQQICLPKNPKCAECLNKNICPASKAKK